MNRKPGKHYWINAKKAAEMLEMSPNTFWHWMQQDVPYVKKNGKYLMVDVKGIERRYNLRRKILDRAQQNYYRITEHIPQYRLASLLQRYSNEGTIRAWNMFMIRDLWKNFEDSQYKRPEMPKRLWAFWRITTFLIKSIERKWK